MSRPHRDRPVVDAAMESYAAEHSTPVSAALAGIDASTHEFSSLPQMMVGALEGRFLGLLVAISGARSIVEVGTFTGYSAISMAESLPAGGRITTLELDAGHAAQARANIEGAGLTTVIEVIEGPALASLQRLSGPFDMAFIDADKAPYLDYYEALVPRMAPGGLIVADNVLREGRVLDAASQNADTVGLRAFNDRVAADPRVECVMLTVRDGVTLIRVRD